MKYIGLLLSVFLLMGARPTQRTYQDEANIRLEFLNAYKRLQGKEWDITHSTPAVSDLSEGSQVVFSSGVVKIFFRVGENLYEILVSSFGAGKQ